MPEAHSRRQCITITNRLTANEFNCVVLCYRRVAKREFLRVRDFKPDSQVISRRIGAAFLLEYGGLETPMPNTFETPAWLHGKVFGRNDSILETLRVLLPIRSCAMRGASADK